MSAELILKTITPVHIGKGNTIDSFEYYCQNGKFYRLDINKILDYIISQKPDAIDKINDWVEGKIDALGNVGKPKDSYKINVFDLVKSLKDNQLETEIKNKLPHFSKYHMAIQSQPSGKDVAEIIKTADNKVYIPGSSIKGMIRNALLNEFIYNADKNDKTEIINIINKNLKKESNDFNKKHFADLLQQFVFNCGYEKYDKNNNKTIVDYSDAKYDLMKFIKVTDTNALDLDKVCILTKPKIVTRKGKIQDQLDFKECIKPNQEFKSRLEIDTDYLKFIAKHYPNLKVKDNGHEKMIWINFHKKIQKVFGIEIDEIRSLKNSEIERKIIYYIQSAIFNFSDFVLYAETKITQSMEKEVNIDNYLNKIDRIFEVDESVPCKLGWGSGFPAVTIFTNFLNNGGLNANKDVFIKVMNKFQIGKAHGKKNQNKPYQANIDTFPSSRKYELDGKIAQAFGWIELKII